MPIHSEEEYQAQLARIVSASTHIANPLLDQATKDRYLQTYDRLVAECEVYRREELCKQFGGLREQYVALGWLPEQETTPEPEPIQEQAPTAPKPAFRDFLDDDE